MKDEALPYLLSPHRILQPLILKQGRVTSGLEDDPFFRHVDTIRRLDGGMAVGEKVSSQLKGENVERFVN